MAIAVAQSTGQAYASASSVTTSSINTTTGSLLVLVAVGYDGGGFSGVTFTPSDSRSNTWTQATALVGDATTWVGVYYNLGGARGNTHTFTLGADTTAQFSIVAIEITGHADASVLDQAASDSNTTGTASVTSSATTNANDLVIGAAVTRGASGTVNWNANGTITGSSGTDIVLDNNAGDTHGAGFAVWYRIVSATGAQTASRSHDAVSSDWSAAVAAFKEAAVGSPTLLRILMDHS